MGTDKLLGKPNKLLGSHLRWTSTPSRRGRNTPSRFVLQSHLARKAHFFAACFRHCCSFKIVDPAYRYCPKCGTEVFRVASSAESPSNSTEPPDSLKTRKFSLPSFKSYKAKKGSGLREARFFEQNQQRRQRASKRSHDYCRDNFTLWAHFGHISGNTCKLDPRF